MDEEFAAYLDKVRAARSELGEAMRALFPDVAPGDTITGLHLSDGGARFYFRERHLGDIADAEFARRFFAIWLDPRTRAPQLRGALLQLPPG